MEKGGKCNTGLRLCGLEGVRDNITQVHGEEDMILTEEAARKKWCRFAMATIYTATAATNREERYNAAEDQRSLILPAATLCIASDCMAWRWANPLQWNGYCGDAGVPLSLSMEEP